MTAVPACDGCGLDDDLYEEGVVHYCVDGVLYGPCDGDGLCGSEVCDGVCVETGLCACECHG